MEQRYKAVMFDLDGTLLDIFRLIYDSFNYSWAHKGIFLTDDEIQCRFGPAEPELIRGVIEEGWQEGLRDHEYAL